MPDVQARMFPLALLLEARAVLLGDCLATIGFFGYNLRTWVGIEIGTSHSLLTSGT